MNRTDPPCAATTAQSVRCDVAAVGRVRLPVECLPELRRRPGPVPAPGLPTSFLKNADEQTVYGLAAVYQAVHDSAMDAASFGSWGILAAPQKIGRTALAQSLPNYRQEGAWGMSPHVIPHRSLHSVSGAISCALKIHGPNFGIGDGPAEALPVALAMLERQRLEGVWLVMTGFEPQLGPDSRGHPVTGSIGVGLALALTPCRTGGHGLRLHLQFEKRFGPPAARRVPLNLFQFLALLDAPVKESRSAPLQDFGLSGRLEVCIEGAAPALRRDPPHLSSVGVPRATEVRHALPLSAHGVEAQR